MRFETIKKPALDKMNKRPNLRNYSAMARSFRWEDIHRELTWLEQGGLNKAFEAIDRHCQTARRDKPALLWEAKGGETERYTFLDLSRLTNKCANLLSELGVKKGDRVFIFLDRIPELYISLFAALKLGAVVGPLFSAFGPEAVRDRLKDSGAKVLVTSPFLRERVYEVREELPDLKNVVLVTRRQAAEEGDDVVLWDDIFPGQPDEFETVATDAEDFAIMHYTSGTTGKPKGAAHVHMAVMGHYATAQHVLDIHD